LIIVRFASGKESVDCAVDIFRFREEADSFFELANGSKFAEREVSTTRIGSAGFNAGRV